MTAPNRASGFRPDIEGLRAIAVLLVVAYHCGVPGLTGGFIGVDVFFVLSGYLITGLLVAEVQGTSRVSLMRFYARRARRLLPAAALVLAVTLGVSAVLLAPFELASASRAGTATAVYLSNFFFASEAADYFAPGVRSNPLLHTWTLAVEEQFYAIWPLLIALGLQFFRSPRLLRAGLASLALLSFAACVWLTSRGSTFAFYGLPARAWEFAAGGLAVLPRSYGLRVTSAGWSALGWVGVGTVLLSGALTTEGAHFPGWIALAPVLGTVAALVAGAELPHGGAGRLLSSAPLRSLGRLSYSWYLWHWPFLVFAVALVPSVTVAGKSLAALAALAMAALAYRLVENPVRFHPYLLPRAALTLALAAATAVLSLAIATASGRVAVRLANAPQFRRIAAAAADFGRLPRAECVTLNESAEVRTCVFGDTSSESEVVLFGDSHAIQWFNPLQRLADAHHWKLTVMVKSACPASDIRTPGRGPVHDARCRSWRVSALRRIVAMRPSLVVIGNANADAGVTSASPSPNDITFDELRDGTRRTLQPLADAGVSVVLIRDNPRFPVSVPRCLARAARRPGRSAGACDVSRATVVNPAAFESEQAAARGLPTVHLFDVTDRLCAGNVCAAEREGVITYRDDGHLTGRYTDALLALVERDMAPFVRRAR